jgi:hypothetical protein
MVQMIDAEVLESLCVGVERIDGSPSTSGLRFKIKVKV